GAPATKAGLVDPGWGRGQVVELQRVGLGGEAGTAVLVRPEPGMVERDPVAETDTPLLCALPVAAFPGDDARAGSPCFGGPQAVPVSEKALLLLIRVVVVGVHRAGTFREPWW